MIALAAAVAGLIRWVREPGPCRPTKLRFDVAAHRLQGDAEAFGQGLDGLWAVGTHFVEQFGVSGVQVHRRRGMDRGLPEHNGILFGPDQGKYRIKTNINEQ